MHIINPTIKIINMYQHLQCLVLLNVTVQITQALEQCKKTFTERCDATIFLFMPEQSVTHNT